MVYSWASDGCSIKVRKFSEIKADNKRIDKKTNRLSCFLYGNLAILFTKFRIVPKMPK